MSNLLEDIQAERDQIEAEVRSMAQLVLLEMCSSIKEWHGCRPVVAALVEDQTELHFPTWSTPMEKIHKFDNISQGLSDRQASGTVVGYGGTLHDTNGKKLTAAVLIIETPHDRVMLVRPFSITEDDLEWDTPFATLDFKSPLTGVFCAN